MNYDGFTTVPRFAWKIINKIRESVFDFLILERNNNYILTNVLYEGEENLYERVKEIALMRGSTFIPVKLLISQEENIQRIQSLDRQVRLKSRNIQNTEPLLSLLNISHPHLLELDVSTITAVESAKKISAHTSQCLLSKIK